MYLHPIRFLWLLLGVSALLLAAVLAPLLIPVGDTVNLFSESRNEMYGERSIPKEISVVHVDFTISDSTLSNPHSRYREHMQVIAEHHLSQESDVLAAFLIHSGTASNQPFFSTHNVLHPRIEQSEGSEQVTQLRREQLYEKFDSVTNQYRAIRSTPSIRDSMLVLETNVIGAIENATRYFSRFGTENDQKNLFLLTDMHHQIDLPQSTISLKTEYTNSKESAAHVAQSLWEQLTAYSDLDTNQGLKNVRIYIHTPNEHLYHLPNRHYNRMVWTIFFQKLNCNKDEIYYY